MKSTTFARNSGGIALMYGIMAAATDAPAATEGPLAALAAWETAGNVNSSVKNAFARGNLTQ